MKLLVMRFVIKKTCIVIFLQHVSIKEVIRFVIVGLMIVIAIEMDKVIL